MVPIPYKTQGFYMFPLGSGSLISWARGFFLPTYLPHIKHGNWTWTPPLNEGNEGCYLILSTTHGTCSIAIFDCQRVNHSKRTCFPGQAAARLLPLAASTESIKRKWLSCNPEKTIRSNHAMLLLSWAKNPRTRNANCNKMMWLIVIDSDS